MIYLILAFVYYISKELEEAAWENTFPKHWSSWWNNERSWVNKYQWGNSNELLSFSMKTWLVFITDASHFFQFVRMVSMAMLVYHAAGLMPLGLFISGYFLGGVVKESLNFFGIRIMK
jgi:hypothetical protein